MQDDSSTSSSDDEDGRKSINAKQEENLKTRLQLRLAASHLPRVAVGGKLNFSRRSPDTFATVISIAESQSGAGRPSQSYYRHTDLLQFSKSNTSLGEDKCMVEWGSTEV